MNETKSIIIGALIGLFSLFVLFVLGDRFLSAIIAPLLAGFIATYLNNGKTERDAGVGGITGIVMAIIMIMGMGLFGGYSIGMLIYYGAMILVFFLFVGAIGGIIRVKTRSSN